MKDKHHRHLLRHNKHSSHQDDDNKSHTHPNDRHHKHRHHHHHRRARSESVEEGRKCKKRKHKVKEAEDVTRPTNHKSSPLDCSSDEDRSTNNKYNKNSGNYVQNSLPKSRWESEEDKVPERQKPAAVEKVSKRQNSVERGAPKWGKQNNNAGDSDKKQPVENKAKPDFGLSGKLAEEVNTYKGVVIKYSEPAEARKPKRRWRLYPFKGDDVLPTLYIHRQSAYLIGRDRNIVDLPVDHPSCSKQHAVLQYRVVPYTRDDGTKGQRIRPYIIDLESANGTFVNNQKIDPKKYVELIERDVIKFAYSSREYVLLHEHSKDDILDDNIDMNHDDVQS